MTKKVVSVNNLELLITFLVYLCCLASGYTYKVIMKAADEGDAAVQKTCNTLPVVTKPGGNVRTVYRYLTG